MMSGFSIANLAQILLIDLSMAGENAIVIGMAVSSLPKANRKMAMTVGIAAAAILRLVMAFFAVQLLQITGLMVAGGCLLLWVSWKMWYDLRMQHRKQQDKAAGKAVRSSEKMSDAIMQIIVADVSMSLDNVLGVAGVARDHMGELVIGLGLSVVLMGFASSKIAGVAERYPKVMYLAVAVILYTALKMIYDGWLQVVAA